MNNDKFHTHQQPNAYRSPWSQGERLGMLLWDICWAIFCSWTPKPLNGWRLIWLKIFGADISGKPFVHQRARINIPWNLTMRDRACLGDRANAYALGKIEMKERSTLAQDAYLCTGTHDFAKISLPLMTAPIIVEPDAFICARAFVQPGIIIGEGAIVGAGALVTKDVAPWSVVAGNPAKVIGQRPRPE